MWATRKSCGVPWVFYETRMGPYELHLSGNARHEPGPHSVSVVSLRRRQALIVLGIATVAFTVILELLDPSHVSSGPTILAFEFAGSQSRAAQIMAEWGAEGRSAAHLSLLLDYGYMLSYGLFFCLAGLAIRDTARARGWRRLAAAGVVVPFFALAAAAFDATENIALLLRLAGNGGSFAPPFATVCSTIKFTLIGIAILYVLCGLVFRVSTRVLQPS